MFLSHILYAFRQWYRYNESLRELNRLRDNELALLGLTRADIPRAALARSER